MISSTIAMRCGVMRMPRERSSSIAVCVVVAMPPVYQCNCIELQPTARDAAINYLMHGIPVAGDCRGKGFGVRAVRARFEASNHRFRVDLTEVVLTSLGGDPPDHLVIESWQQGKG